MTFPFGNATVQRLTFERQLAERLNHLRFSKITECLLRIYHGHAFRDIADWLPISLRTVYNWLSLFIRRRFAWLCGIIFKAEVAKPDSMRSNASACMRSSKKARLPAASPVVSGPRA